MKKLLLLAIVSILFVSAYRPPIRHNLDPSLGYAWGEVIKAQYTGDGYDHLIVGGNYIGTDGSWYRTDISFWCEHWEAVWSGVGLPTWQRVWGLKTWYIEIPPYENHPTTEWILSGSEVFNTHINGAGKNLVNSGDVQVGETYPE